MLIVSLVRKYCNPANVSPPAKITPRIIGFVISNLSLNICLRLSPTESVVITIIPDIEQKIAIVNAVVKATPVLF